jgi:hypothetical protein
MAILKAETAKLGAPKAEGTDQTADKIRAVCAHLLPSFRGEAARLKFMQNRDLQFGKIDTGEVKARSWHGGTVGGCVRLSIGCFRRFSTTA